MATFGLIHGAWHGAWCWASVVAELQTLGHAARTVDLPVDRADATTVDYARVAAAAFADGPPPVIVAHSMAGLVAPLVAAASAVRGLVYLAAVLRRPGMSLADDRAAGLNADISPADFGKELARDGERLTFWPHAAAAARALYQDASPEEAAWAFARLRHQKGYWSDCAPLSGWPAVATASIVCAEDRAVNPAWSRRVARDWLKVAPIEMAGAHSPFLTRPRELAALLDRLARTTFA
jgi:hypothetical protein